MTDEQWKLVEQALQVIGGFTTLGGMIAGLIILLRPAKRLRCNATYVPFRRDPLFYLMLAERLPDIASENDRRSMSKWQDLADFSSRSIRQLWILDIQNVGKKKLTSVQITLPDVIAVEFKGVEVKSYADTAPILIGDLPPMDSRTIYAWGQGYSGMSASDVSLVHASGHGVVRVYRIAHPFFSWLTNQRTPATVALVLSVILLLIVVVFASLRIFGS